jgi:hypothetical protein
MHAVLSFWLTFRRIIELFISLHVLVSYRVERDSITLVGVHSQRRASTAAGAIATCINSKSHFQAVSGLIEHVSVHVSHRGRSSGKIAIGHAYPAYTTSSAAAQCRCSLLVEVHQLQLLAVQYHLLTLKLGTNTTDKQRDALLLT